MSALSIINVAASVSSAQAPAQSGANEAASDTSPFAMLLAAITAADPDLQAALPPDGTQAVSPPGVTQADAPPNVTQAVVPPGVTQIAAPSDQPQAAPIADTNAPPLLAAANDDDAESAPEDTATDPASAQPAPADPATLKIGGKPDKKTNTDKSGANDAVNPVQPQILSQPPIPPIVQVAVQIQTVAGNDDDGDDQQISGIAASGSSPPAIPASTPAVPAAAPATPDQTAPAPSQSSQIDTKQDAAPSVAQPLAAANDDDDALPSRDLAAAFQNGPVIETTSAKFAPIRAPLGKPANQAAPETPAPPIDDTDSDTEVPAAPIVAADAQEAANVQQPAPESATWNPAAQPAPQKPAPDKAGKPAPEMATAPTRMAAADTSPKSDAPTSPVATDNNGDSKPAHAATASTSQSQPQPDISQPPPQGTIQPMSQTLAAINGGAAPSSGLNISVHVANHLPDSQSSDLQSSTAVAPNTDMLAISIAARSQSGAKQFDIRLDPPELGRVDVRLSIDASGKTQAHMTTDQPQTLELLQRDAPNLTRALRDAGLDVSQNGLNFSLKGQGQQQGQNQNGAFAPSRSLSLSAVAQNTESAPSAGSVSSLLGSARLDIHV